MTDTDNKTRRPAGLPVLAVLLAGMLFVLFLLNRPGTRSVVAVINGHEITAAQFQAEVHLKEVKYALADRERPVNRPELLNRMIGDVFLLEAAAEAGVTPPEAAVQAEIDRILGRFDLSRPEMEALLAEHDLAWIAFEQSIRDYVTLTQFTQGVLLADVAAGQRQAYLNAWMAAQYEAAEMNFDPEFLDAVNASPPDTLTDQSA